MNKRVCVVIPIYKSRLNKYEKLSIHLVEEKLSCYDIFFITHQKLNMRGYSRYKDIKTLYFPRRFFYNSFTYSRLLIKQSFYQKFTAYEYILIVQTDALVLGDAQQLEMIMDKGYDYWGARWGQPVEICSFEFGKKIKNKLLKICPNTLRKYIFRNPRRCYVGNGGLSLRNVSKTMALLNEKSKYAWIWFDNEDKFFAYHGLINNVNYRIAPKNIVDEFSLEDYINLNIDKVFPFGVHAWEKWGKWKTIKYLKNNGCRIV